MVLLLFLGGVGPIPEWGKGRWNGRLALWAGSCMNGLPKGDRSRCLTVQNQYCKTPRLEGPSF